MREHVHYIDSSHLALSLRRHPEPRKQLLKRIADAMPDRVAFLVAAITVVFLAVVNLFFTVDVSDRIIPKG